MQSPRASANRLDPPFVAQRAPPLPKLTQPAAVDKRPPVFAEASQAKNSPAVTPTKAKHNAVDTASLLTRRRKFVPMADARLPELAPSQFPDMTTSRPQRLHEAYC
jgi:hypothetical protein